MPRRSSRYSRARPKARSSAPARASSASAASRSESEADVPEPPVLRRTQSVSEIVELQPLPCRIVEQLKNSCCFLFHQGIGDAEMELVAEIFKANTAVNELNLGKNSISDAGILALFYPLRTDALVTIVHLHHNRISDAGAGILAEAMKSNSTVQELYIGSNRIGDIGAEAIAEALKVNSTVRRLSLSKNMIGDAGAEAISEALKVNSTLCEISLDFNLITERGIAALTALHSANKTLQKLALAGNKVKDADKEQDADLPNSSTATSSGHLEYKILLENKDLSLSGVGFQIANDALFIGGIEAGLLEDWNESSPPETQVKVGDRVVEVNGVRGQAQDLFLECTKERLEIVLKRKEVPPPQEVPLEPTLTRGQQVLVDGFKDRPEINGQKGTAMQWYEAVKRWKVKLEDGSVIMARTEDLKIDNTQILAGGYKVGDFVLSRVSHAFKSGAHLRAGDEGMVVAPGCDPPAQEGDLRLCVTFSMGRVIMLAPSLKPKDAELSPSEFQVSLDGARQGLGLSLQFAPDGCTLFVKSIAEGGLVDVFNNHSSGDTVVRVGHRIVEVNGVRGDARLLVSECKQNPVSTLVIMQ